VPLDVISQANALEITTNLNMIMNQWWRWVEMFTQTHKDVKYVKVPWKWAPSWYLPIYRAPWLKERLAARKRDWTHWPDAPQHPVDPSCPRVSALNCKRWSPTVTSWLNVNSSDDRTRPKTIGHAVTASIHALTRIRLATTGLDDDSHTQHVRSSLVRFQGAFSMTERVRS
jgi:hypothetical protein